jgi:hypothetical protein
MCTQAYHDYLKASLDVWDEETDPPPCGCEQYDEGVLVLIYGNCKHCGSTLAKLPKVTT